jgi:hypothetical protein
VAPGAADRAPTTADPDASPQDARAARAAERAGADAGAIERLPFDLSALTEEGLLVNVDAQGFGLLDRRLGWDDLGVTLPEGSDLAFRPPRCGLLPDRYRLPLLRPAARAHAALRRYSFTFRLTETLLESSAYRWVPWTAFEAFEAEFGEAQRRLAAAKADVLADYDAVREAVVRAFLELAADSAQRLAATGRAVPPRFEDAVVEGVLTAMPGPDDLRSRLVLRYRVGVLLLGSEMLEEQRRAAEVRRRAEAEQASLASERRRHEAQERLVQQELWAEEERLRRRLEAEAEERRREAAVKERLRELRLEAARERLRETMSPLEEGARQLHAAVYESATAIRDSLRRHQALRGASARRARDLARWFRAMNWQSDAELEGLVAELERLATRAPRRGKRDPQPIDGVLGEIIELTYAGARALSEPSRMGALEL